MVLGKALRPFVAPVRMRTTLMKERLVGQMGIVFGEYVIIKLHHLHCRYAQAFLLED